jgi:hypothetical protein
VGDKSVVIDERYCGPPDSGNGGYVCGLVAGFLGEPAEVTLRRPPPIGRPLRVREGPDRSVALLDQDDLVAEGHPARPEAQLPAPVTREEAAEAARLFRGFSLHPFPTCFVCGPRRAEGDGLRIFTGPVTGRGLVAAPWTPDRTLAGGDGLVPQEFLWAALDCPGAFANGFPEIRMVLGRLTAEVVRPAQGGQGCVVLGWSEGSEGRKHFAGTAIFGAEGEVLALARATWIGVASAASADS